MAIHLSQREFEQAVRDAVDAIPAEFAPYLGRVIIEVEPRPTPGMLTDLELDDPGDLLGIYLGTPLTERSIEAPPLLPDRVVIYKENVEQVCDTIDDVVDEIRLTVLHEVGHHFGLDEDHLEELGYG